MGSSLILILLLACFALSFVASQELNTDGFFLSDFMQKMGAKTAILSSSSSSPSYSVCSWEGVLCDAREENVVGLTASGKGLSGVIPETTIAKLTMLQVLDLSNNHITSFSADFWSLGATLTTLNLSYNRLTGALPGNLGNFGRLETLDLSFNGLTGEVPGAISALSSLRVLKLRGNGLGGGIPLGILNCRNLMKLDLSMNRLNGTFGFGFGFGLLTKLRSLNLAGNEIRGRSSHLLGFKSLTYLNISMNLFQGSVKGVFLESGALEVIDLSRNQFRGHISQLHAFNSSFNSSRLVFLDISENQISGKFFDNFFKDAHNLKHLNLARNRFSNQRFPQIHKLSSLEYLNMSETSLVGEIPVEITRLSSLTTLDLSGNRLVGRIPRLYNPNLQVLDLSFNNLTGDVSLSLLQRLARMKRFNLSYNNLTLCGANFSLRTHPTAFIGALNNCPIAVNPNVPGRKTNRSRGLQLYLVIAFSVASFFVGLIILGFAFRRKTTKWAMKQHSYREETNISGPFSFHAESTTWVADVKNAASVPVVIFEKPLLNFTFADLLAATSHFDRGTLLAEGRFGPVYRGYLAGGIHVAVKVLVSGSTLTDQEAARELEYLGGVKHPNLVPLTGYCIAGDQRIAIYEYMDNGNLQNFLHDLPLGVQTTEDWSTDTWEEDRNVDIQHVGSEGLLLTWTFRCKIALGVARALAFLHHGCFPPIIHRDVKASSVYLDSDLEPRLSDFGLAKIFGNGLEERLARGTPGYAPPEFSGPENVAPTPKSDVYGFGVVLLELITGKKPIGDDYPDSQDSNLVDWVKGLVRKKQSSRAIDPKILGTAPENHLEEALRIGYLCTADLPMKRPTMQQIVGLLKDIEPACFSV